MRSITLSGPSIRVGVHPRVWDTIPSKTALRFAVSPKANGLEGRAPGARAGGVE